MTPIIHAINYGKDPTQNAIARLQARLKQGSCVSSSSHPRGYLDSVLEALEISPSSQTLVYSRTSLQFLLITAATPRSIYFQR